MDGIRLPHVASIDVEAILFHSVMRCRVKSSFSDGSWIPELEFSFGRCRFVTLLANLYWFKTMPIVNIYLVRVSFDDNNMSDSHASSFFP